MEVLNVLSYAVRFNGEITEKPSTNNDL